MDNRAGEILGKTISGVVIKESINGKTSPDSQLFLLFDDNSCYEFYCSSDIICRTKGINQNSGLDFVKQYMSDRHEISYMAVTNPETGETNFKNQH